MAKVKIKEKKTLTELLVPEKQREAFAAMTVFQRIGYIWHYYWMYFLIVLIVLGVTFGVTADILDAPRDIRLYIMMDTPTDGEQTALETAVAEFLNADGSKGSVQTEAVTFGTLNPQHVYEQMNVTVKMGAKYVDVILCNQELYEYLLTVKGLLTLDDALAAGLDAGNCEIRYDRAGSDDPQSELPLEESPSAYALELPDGRLGCIAANCERTNDAFSALGFIARDFH